MVFGWAQIIMDIQPLFVLITGEGHLHGFSHTCTGATLLAVFAALSGKYLSEIGLKIIGISNNSPSGSTPTKITWWIALMSAFIGTYSHVILDSIMHGDVESFYPFSQENEILGLITIPQLHMLCIYSALAGGVIYYSVWYIRKKYSQNV